jgi:hypothetical protein
MLAAVSSAVSALTLVQVGAAAVAGCAGVVHGS